MKINWKNLANLTDMKTFTTVLNSVNKISVHLTSVMQEVQVVNQKMDVLQLEGPKKEKQIPSGNNGNN